MQLRSSNSICKYELTSCLKFQVRWADIEERRKQVKMADIGFVVGQTNWKRLMDPNEGTQQALERTKIIPNRFDDRS